MKKITAVWIVLMMLLATVACGAVAQTEPKEEISETAVYQDFTLVLGDAEFADGLVKVHATYTNKSQDPYYALCCFAVRAFQDDKQISDASDINGDEAALIREIKNGETIDVTYVFELQGESPVEVLIGEPTADMTTIGRKIYEGVG